MNYRTIGKTELEVLDHVACVIPGFRNARQVQCNLAAADRVLSPADMDFIRTTLQ